jgi:thiol-disulfide isomerase/thioredoxin
MRLKFFILSLFLVTTLELAGCDSQGDSALKGASIPYIKVQNMIGETLRIQPHGFDKPALVNIWATWCKPCVLEMPSLETVAQKGDFRVIAISNDTNKEKVRSFIKEGGYKHIQFLYDAFGRQSRQVFKANGLPMTLLVDKNAVVQHTFLGEEDWQSEDVQKILNKYRIEYDD